MQGMTLYKKKYHVHNPIVIILDIFPYKLFMKRATPLYMAFSLNHRCDWTVAKKSIKSAGMLSSNVIRVIPYSECKTKGEVSVENGKSCWDCYRHFVPSSWLSVKPESPTGTGRISQRGIYTVPAQEAHQHHGHTDSHREKCLHNNHILQAQWAIY